MNTKSVYKKSGEYYHLTIISVSYNSRPYLEVNLQLVKFLNPEVSFRWIVVQNTPFEDRNQDIDDTHPDFIVIDGPVLTSEELNNIGYGSIQHAKAVEMALSYCDSSPILILDPDCFIVRPKWISSIRSEMRKNSWAFWGVPYHPERLENFRLFRSPYTEFPCAICLFLHRAVIYNKDIMDLDFRGSFNGRYYNKTFRHHIDSLILEDHPNLLKSILRYRKIEPKNFKRDFFAFILRFWELRHHYTFPLWRKDIGALLYRKFRKMGLHGYCSVRVNRPIPKWFRFLKKILPGNIFSYPKDPNAWTMQQFQSNADIDMVRDEGQGKLEQFFWKKKPFALHLGKVSYSDDKQTIDTVAKYLNELTGSRISING